jgi:hypothetical protein
MTLQLQHCIQYVKYYLFYHSKILNNICSRYNAPLPVKTGSIPVMDSIFTTWPGHRVTRRKIFTMESITAQFVDIPNRNIYPATVTFHEGRVIAIDQLPENTAVPEKFILPGFTDAHVHIESSMLVPAEFARLAVD